MKFKNLSLRLKDKSGIIIIIALWIVIILSALAVNLGRRTSLDFALAKYTVSKTQATFLAWSAMMYAMNEMQAIRDQVDAPRNDTLYQSGFVLTGQDSAQDIFKDISLGSGYFDIGYFFKNNPEDKPQFCFGFQDEAGRLNLNAINTTNYKILSHLIMLLGFEAEAATTVGSALADWIDADSTVTNPPYGAETDHYESLANSYPCKNAPLESLEELLLVKGATSEILCALYDYVTIFPMQAGALKVNINTAPAIVLKAVLRAMAEDNPNFAQPDADAAAEKIIAYRSGPDQLACTPDDEGIMTNNLGPVGLNISEQAIVLSALLYFSQIGQHVRVTSRGYAFQSDISTTIQGVIDRNDLTVLFWKKQ